MLKYKHSIDSLNVCRKNILFAGILLLVCGLSSLQAASPSLEYQVKASFLFNFMKFIEWPDRVVSDSENAIIISVYGEDMFGSALESISKEKIDGKNIIIKRCKDFAETMPCHILFCTDKKAVMGAGIILQHPVFGVLTVGQEPGFASQGGNINFVIIDDKVKFEINQASARASRLTISSQLLKLATTVYNDELLER